MTEIVMQSLPLCIVVSMVIVALEEDTLARWSWRSLRYLVLFYGGILLFSIGFFGLELVADRLLVG